MHGYIFKHTTPVVCVFNCLLLFYLEVLNCPHPCIFLLSVSGFYDSHFNGKKFLISYRGRFNADSSDTRDNVMKKKKAIQFHQSVAA